MTNVILKSKVTRPLGLFVPTSRPNPKDIQFTVTKDRNAANRPTKILKLSHVWVFCFKMTQVISQLSE